MFRDELRFQGIIICLQVIALTIFYFLALKPERAVGAELTAKEIVSLIWSQSYPSSLKSEVFFGKEAEDNGRDIGAWTNFKSGQAEIFIGRYKSNKGFIRRSGGTLYQSNKSNFGYKVYVSRETGRRANVKKKAGSYDSLANSTQMNYFDIVRSLFMENSENFEFSFTKDAGAIKAVPRNAVKGDYAYRFFYLSVAPDGSLLISRIEYFSGLSDKEPSKVRISEYFQKYDIGDAIVWRAGKISVVTGDKSTVIEFTDRIFNFDFGKLSKKDLKRGCPPKWRD